MTRFGRPPRAAATFKGRDRYGSAPFLAGSPWLGLALAALGGLIFGILAANVRKNGPLLAWDVPASQAIHRREVRNPPWLIPVMGLISSLGRELATLITGLLAVDWIRQRRWRPLAMLLIGVIGGNTWFVILSRFFGRHRPEFPDLAKVIPGPGFPSGHSLTSVTLYGLLFYLRLPQLSTPRSRLIAACESALMILAVGGSRLYLCAHYLTDVLAGYAFGLFWAALTYTGLEYFFSWLEGSRRVAGAQGTSTSST